MAKKLAPILIILETTFYLEDLDEDLMEVSTGQVGRTDQISDLSKTVLKRMYASSERRPRRGDISKLGSWAEEELDKALEQLEANGLVRSMMG